MKVKVEVTGVPELQAALQRIDQAVRAGKAGVMGKAAEPIADLARGYVQVETGETRDSIQVTLGADGAAVVAGGAALFLEFGTSRMPAAPFMRPALDGGKADALQVAADEVETIVKGAA